MNINNEEKLIEELIQSRIDSIMPESDSFQLQTTPKKNAKQLWLEARNGLKEKLMGHELRKRLHGALALMKQYLPQRLSPSEWEQLHTKLQSTDSWTESLGALQKNQEDGEDLGWVTYQMLAGITDDHILAIYNLALDLNKDKIEGALNLMEFLVLYAPNIPEFWDARGLLLLEAKDFKEAKNSFLFACTLRDGYPDAYLHLVECYIHLDEPKEAKKTINQMQQALHGVLLPEKACFWASKTRNLLIERVAKLPL